MWITFYLFLLSFSLEERSPCPLLASKNPTLSCTREVIYCWDCNLFFCNLLLMNIKHDRCCIHILDPHSISFMSIRRLLRSKVSTDFQKDTIYGYISPSVRKIRCKCTLCIEKGTLPQFTVVGIFLKFYSILSLQGNLLIYYWVYFIQS